jgi:hypothetical protein
MRLPRLLLLTLAALALSALAVSSSPARAFTPPAVVAVKPIGAPTWKPIDFHQFSAPIGTADDGYAEFTSTQVGILPEPFYRNYPQLGLGPDAPHQPPYDQDIARGVAAQRYHQTPLFTRPEFSAGNGVWLAWMNVPAPGVRGASSDFTRGPIIPNTLFPIHVTGSSTRFGRPYDTLTDFSVPKLDVSIDPRFAHVDGFSHFPIFIADNSDFGPAGTSPLGAYVWKFKLVDQSGSGWEVDAAFAVA